MLAKVKKKFMSSVPVGGKELASRSESEKHIVYVRKSETSTDSMGDPVDVRSLQGVSWCESREKYKVEFEVPLSKQSVIDSNPRIRSQMNIERRGNAMYLTSFTESAECAHGIFQFMKVLYEDQA